MGGTNIRIDRQTDGWMDGRNFSSFYRTSSPVGAAAQKGLKRVKKKTNEVKIFPELDKA